MAGYDVAAAIGAAGRLRGSTAVHAADRIVKWASGPWFSHPMFIPSALLEKMMCRDDAAGRMPDRTLFLIHPQGDGDGMPPPEDGGEGDGPSSDPNRGVTLASRMAIMTDVRKPRSAIIPWQKLTWEYSIAAGKPKPTGERDLPNRSLSSGALLVADDRGLLYCINIESILREEYSLGESSSVDDSSKKCAGDTLGISNHLERGRFSQKKFPSADVELKLTPFADLVRLVPRPSVRILTLIAIGVVVFALSFLSRMLNT